MATKRQELIDGCFAKAGDDEPLFVFKATDMLAPPFVRDWAMKFLLANLENVPSQNEEYGYFRVPVKVLKKYMEALENADAMEQWPNRKLPD